MFCKEQTVGTPLRKWIFIAKSPIKTLLQSILHLEWFIAFVIQVECATLQPTQPSVND